MGGSTVQYETLALEAATGVIVSIGLTFSRHQAARGTSQSLDHKTFVHGASIRRWCFISL